MRRIALTLALASVALAALRAEPPPPRNPPPPGAEGDPTATFFMGRLKYSKNSGNDCGTAGATLTRLVAGASTIRVGRERQLTLTDSLLDETPFVFMNGHNDFVLSAAELKSLATYFEHGGFLFASGCCTNPAFPKAWRRELGRIFPGEAVRRLPYDHPIYRASYRIERVRCLHEDRDIYLEGLHAQGRLVAVLCEEGLCCSFSMQNGCNVGKGVGPEDGRKLALNIAVYAMTH